MNIFITVLSGACFFAAIYFTFDYWYKKFWTPLLETRNETLKLLEELFIEQTPEQVLRWQLIVGSSLGCLFFLLTWPNLMVGIPLGIGFFWIGWRLPYYYVKLVLKRMRVAKFSSQMVDGLTLMANGIKSGLNIPQAMQIVVNEMPNPIAQEMGLVLNENKLGLTLEKAFENLAERIPTEDVNMFVTSVNILKETGGNIAETFDTIVVTIRERLKLQNKIAAMTAQGMTSAVIVSLLPWGLALVLYMVDPALMTPLFSTALGWVILLVIIALQTVGFFVIMKIVKIKV